MIEAAVPLRVGAVIPANDEQATIGRVVSDLLARQSGVATAAVVCDNASTDATAAVAQAAGAVVVSEPVPGYGRACLRAMAALPDVDVVLFIDADGQFDATAASSLIDEIRAGADLAIGSRTLGTQEGGALTLPQRFGNWVATRMIRVLWGHRFSDLGPYRAIRKSALERLQMSSPTFGWTVEMQVKAIQQRLICREVPVTTRRRIGRSKITGTMRGVAAAGVGIIGTILTLYLRERVQRITARAQTLRGEFSRP